MAEEAGPSNPAGGKRKQKQGSPSGEVSPSPRADEYRWGRKKAPALWEHAEGASGLPIVSSAQRKLIDAWSVEYLGAPIGWRNEHGAFRLLAGDVPESGTIGQVLHFLIEGKPGKPGKGKGWLARRLLALYLTLYQQTRLAVNAKEHLEEQIEKLEKQLNQSSTPVMQGIAKAAVSPQSWDGDIWNDPDSDIANPVQVIQTTSDSQGSLRTVIKRTPYSPTDAQNIADRFCIKSGEGPLDWITRVWEAGGQNIS